MVDLEKVKSAQQVAWSTGDYAAVGSTLVLPAELLAEALDLRSGWRVLDVAAGNGNMSLAAARRGGRVTSTDYVPSLLERGRVRAAAEGWKIEFEEADAENLPYADSSFDCVVSTFGVMFAPNQPRAAAEMMRVCRPGGKIGMVNWTPESYVGQIFRCMSKYAPPPPGTSPAMLWGSEARLLELFPGVAKIECVSRTAAMRGRSEAAWLDQFRKYYGPMNRVFAGLDETTGAALERDLLETAHALNRADDGTMVVESEYLEIVITR